MARSTNSKFDANVIGTSELHARAPGCFGPGDVNFNLGPTHGQELKFFLSKSNAISSSATLSLTSKSRRFGQGEIEITLASGVTQVVTGLVVDGVRATRRASRSIGNVTYKCWRVVRRSSRICSTTLTFHHHSQGRGFGRDAINRRSWEELLLQGYPRGTQVFLDQLPPMQARFMARSTNSKFDVNVIGTSELHAKTPGCSALVT